MEECEFEVALRRDEAIQLWESARRKVEALPPVQACEQPVQHRLNSADHKTIQKFRKQYSRATDIVDFFKVDPMNLIVHQLHVIAEIQPPVRQAVAGEGWFRTALLDLPNQAAVKWRVEADQVIFELPHGEFFLSAPTAPDTRLQLLQNPAFATVVRLKNRVLLANGYHRAFARCVAGRQSPSFSRARNNFRLGLIRRPLRSVKRCYRHDLRCSRTFSTIACTFQRG